MAQQGSASSATSVRVGMIGCGDIARRVHLPALRTAGARVLRFADTDLAAADAAAAESGETEAMTTDEWRHVVASPHIDAVDICTPNHLHAEMALAVLDAGKHVLVESPMALTAAEADRLLKAAARKGVMLVPALSVRFIAPYAAMVDAARAGTVGRITQASISFGHDGPDVRHPSAGWYLEKAKAGGGALIDLGVAQVDLLRRATGREVAEVSAVTLGRRGEVEEQAEARLRFDDGATALVRAAWTGPANEMVLVGEEGTLRLGPKVAPRLERPDGSTEPLTMPEAAPSIEAVFAAAVSQGESPTVTAADGRAAVAVIAAAYEAATSGETVTVARPAW